MIVHVITGLKRGGAENALYRLLSREPHPERVHVVSLTDSGVFGERLQALGIGVTCLALHPRRPSPFKCWQLVRLLRQWRPQLVQTWMYHADLVGGLAARMAGVPVCWGIRHSDLSAQHNKASTRLVARLCAALSGWIPARIVSCSWRAMEVHRALGYAAPFAVVPNGLDVSAWMPRPELRALLRDQLGLPEHAFVFAHAGRDDPQKDHPGLAVAFSRLHAIRPQARLLLCGAGLAAGDAHFGALPFTDEARDSVQPLGPRDDLPQLWQAADAFVLSSVGEAFPNVVAEAMACGLPCVVTDVGDAAEIVGETGWVVPPADPEALASAMREVLDMAPPNRRRLGVVARERIEALFTLERMAEGFRSAWAEALARARAS